MDEKALDLANIQDMIVAQQEKGATLYEMVLLANQALAKRREDMAKKSWTSIVVRTEVLKLSALGKTTKEIAEQLNITFDNVKFHKKQLLIEYKANNICHVVYLWQQKLLENYA